MRCSIGFGKQTGDRSSAAIDRREGLACWRGYASPSGRASEGISPRMSDSSGRGCVFCRGVRPSLQESEISSEPAGRNDWRSTFFDFDGFHEPNSHSNPHYLLMARTGITFVQASRGRRCACGAGFGWVAALAVFPPLTIRTSIHSLTRSRIPDPQDFRPKQTR